MIAIGLLLLSTSLTANVAVVKAVFGKMKEYLDVLSWLSSSAVLDSPAHCITWRLAFSNEWHVGSHRNEEEPKCKSPEPDTSPARKYRGDCPNKLTLAFDQKVGRYDFRYSLAHVDESRYCESTWSHRDKHGWSNAFAWQFLRHKSIQEYTIYHQGYHEPDSLNNDTADNDSESELWGHRFLCR